MSAIPFLAPVRSMEQKWRRDQVRFGQWLKRCVERSCSSGNGGDVYPWGAWRGIGPMVSCTVD